MDDKNTHELVCDFLNSIYDHTMNGDIASLDLYVSLNEIKKQCDELQKKIKSDAIEDIDNGCFVPGYSVEYKERKTYTYQTCEIYDKAKNELKNIEKMMKSLAINPSLKYDGIPAAQVKFQNAIYIKKEPINNKVGDDEISNANTT